MTASTSSSLVSIIIPAFNAEAYLGDALQAALNQTHKPIEIVVVDDGSVDNTESIASAYDDSRIRYLRQPNHGQSAAINRGVEESSGDFIKLLDADDWINPQHIESQLEVVQETEGTIASCRWGYFVDDFTRPSLRDETTNRNYGDPLQWLLDSFQKDEGMVGGWRWLIPRSVWESTGGYDEKLTLYNDVHFSAKLMSAAKAVHFSPNAEYSYRRGVGSSMSVDESRATMESVFRALNSAADVILSKRDSPEFRQLFADRFQMWLFRYYPDFPDLVEKTETRISELGGSDLSMQGGMIQRWLLPLVGWKRVRKIQSAVYRLGWRHVLAAKNRTRLAKFE